MIPTNVLTSTFHIRWKNSTGTAFALDYIGRHYLVTAKHVVEGIASGDVIQIRQSQKWRDVTIDLVGIGADHVDVAVLSYPTLLGQTHSLESSAEGRGLGQQVYFAGFPFGWQWEAFPFLVESPPTPFVKSGVLSGAFQNHDLLVIDGHGNAGFSGGPVVLNPRDQDPSVFRVAGVVSFCPTPTLEPIVNENCDPILDHNNKPIGYIQENPGFLVATSIRFVTDLIDANPIGRPNPNSPIAPQSPPK